MSTAKLPFFIGLVAGALKLLLVFELVLGKLWWISGDHLGHEGSIAGCDEYLKTEYNMTPCLGGRLTAHRLHEQHGSNHDQADVNVLEKGVTMEAAIDRSSEQYRCQDERHRHQVITGYGGNPEPGEPISRHANYAGGKKVSLQGRAKMLGRPAAHRTVNRQRRPVHPISTSQHAGKKSEDEKPQPAIAVQLRRLAADQRIRRERHDHHCQGRFDQAMVAAREQQ